MSLPHAMLQRMEPAILLGLAVIALLILGATLFAASIPLLGYLAAAALFFSGLIGPGLGCLLIGVIGHAFWRRRQQLSWHRIAAAEISKSQATALALHKPAQQDDR